MKVVILCGGKGTRLREETEYRPKPMVEIGGKPILWHIMKGYARFGFTEFVLALGYKGNLIREYFLNYEYHRNDFTVTLGDRKSVEVHGASDEAGWKVTLVETGEDAMTGARVKRCGRYITEDAFMLTYGDGLADVDVRQLAEYHRSHGRIGTITGVNPLGRFGKLVIENRHVVQFTEKPKLEGAHESINGGFMVFQRGFLDYLTDDNGCVLEKGPLERLAQDRQLMLYHHEGYWQCMDTYRDYLLLQQAWESGRAPWLIDESTCSKRHSKTKRS